MRTGSLCRLKTVTVRPEDESTAVKELVDSMSLDSLQSMVEFLDDGATKPFYGDMPQRSSLSNDPRLVTVPRASDNPTIGVFRRIPPPSRPSYSFIPVHGIRNRSLLAAQGELLADSQGPMITHCTRQQDYEAWRKKQEQVRAAQAALTATGTTSPPSSSVTATTAKARDKVKLFKLDTDKKTNARSFYAVASIFSPAK